MKKILLLLTVIISAIMNTNGQDSRPIGTCYFDYYQAFRDRGAKPVPDGVTEVVVSIRKDNFCTCLVGQITVKGGVPINDLMIARENGTYEKFNFVPNAKYTNSEAKFLNYISNGMSPAYLSSNDEIINLFFIKYLNDIPAKFKVAPPIK